ncbi:MAG: hypothetical protein QME74_10930, partial [Candidatus Edwardsbacteria bacterium]|nr:hypothetical protein [Candidatus Edwardsbacteria bacterium]
EIFIHSYVNKPLGSCSVCDLSADGALVVVKDERMMIWRSDNYPDARNYHEMPLCDFRDK